MKLPEPVAWLDAEMQQAYTIDELADAEGTGFAPLFTESQLREALANQEAVMRQVSAFLQRVYQWEEGRPGLHDIKQIVREALK